jgi:hypothetical protein
MKYLLAFSIFLFSLPALSQTAVSFTYDAAGNRILRMPCPTCLYVKKDNPTPGLQISSLDKDGEQLTGMQAPLNEGETDENIHSEESKTGSFGFKFYPNPTKGEVKIEFEQTFLELDGRELHVFDLQGKRLHRQNISGLSAIIDLSSYAAGYYVFKIRAKGFAREWLIMKE